METLETAATTQILGRSSAVRRMLEQIERVARSPRTTVLITGESGAGKELAARAIHERSARGGGPWVAVNCAALSDGLLEAELFGYEPGAFTGGSARGGDGLFAAAEGGTLLLDEIAELARPLQAKLLRVLQERSFRRVGATRERAFDARIVAATNRDLEREVAAGRFREDLFYRLNVMAIAVPSLRERREDVAALAEHFLARLARELTPAPPGFSPAARSALERHAWPGNVRELQNAVERAALSSAGEHIEPRDLALEPLNTAEASIPLTADENRTLKAVEAAWIRRVLAETGGNKCRAAAVLGIHRATLHRKLEELGRGV